MIDYIFIDIHMHVVIVYRSVSMF